MDALSNKANIGVSMSLRVSRFFFLYLSSLCMCVCWKPSTSQHMSEVNQFDGSIVSIEDVYIYLIQLIRMPRWTNDGARTHSSQLAATAHPFHFVAHHFHIFALIRNFYFDLVRFSFWLFSSNDFVFFAMASTQEWKRRRSKKPGKKIA